VIYGPKAEYPHISYEEIAEPGEEVFEADFEGQSRYVVMGERAGQKKEPRG
jgi:hypothetical protein